MTTERHPTVAPSGALAHRPRDHRRERWLVLRDALVFQGKLFVDGLKDLALAPISAIAAIIGVVFRREHPGRPFYAVLRIGRAFDRWVNLFGAAAHHADEPAATTPEGLDDEIRKLEALLVEQHRRGGITAKAKDAVDKALDNLHGATTRPNTAPQDVLPPRE